MKKKPSIVFTSNFHKNSRIILGNDIKGGEMDHIKIIVLLFLFLEMVCILPNQLTNKKFLKVIEITQVINSLVHRVKDQTHPCCQIFLLRQFCLLCGFQNIFYHMRPQINHYTPPLNFGIQFQVYIILLYSVQCTVFPFLPPSPRDNQDLWPSVATHQGAQQYIMYNTTLQ